MPTDLAELARMRVVYQVPGMDRVEVRRDVVYREIGGSSPARMLLDVYLPPPVVPAEPHPQPHPEPRLQPNRRPAVLLVHGGPLPQGVELRIKDMGVFVSYGELLAASGLVTVVPNHLHRGWQDQEESADNLAAAIAWLRGQAEPLAVDPERLCVWAFSGGGPQLAPFLASPSPAVRCLVAYYALLDLQELPDMVPPLPAEIRDRFSPAARVASAPASAAASARWPPMLLARAGQDREWMNRPFDAFIQTALAAGAEIEVLNHAAGRHGFDVFDDVPRTREIIARTVEFIRTHTAASGAE